MVRNIIISVCVLIFIKVNAQIEADKALHFLGGNLYGLVGGGIANEISNGNRAWTFAGAVGGSLLIGLAKESIDKNQYDGWDNDDLLATILGGVAVGITIDIFKKRKLKKRAQLLKNAVGFNTLVYTKENPNSENYTTSLSLLGISKTVLYR